MYYWCALWFWEYDDAADLPTCQEFWGDIEDLLDVDNSQLDTRTRQALERVGSNMVSEDMLEYSKMTEDESQIVTKPQEEIITDSHARVSLFADDLPLLNRIRDGK